MDIVARRGRIGIRGFIEATDSQQPAGRSAPYTIPGTGEPAETWKDGKDALEGTVGSVWETATL